jgi:putative acetyltransferase
VTAGGLPVSLRAERSDDVEAVRALLVAAFGGAAEADLVDALRDDPAVWLGMSLVAVAPGARRVGYVLLSRVQVGSQDAAADRTGVGLALAPLAVDARWRRRGIGAALVRHALDDARACGERLVVVLGDPAYYSRFGFRAARELGIDGPYGNGPHMQAVELHSGGGDVPTGWVTYPSQFGSL